jgi:hypothetical protein
MMIRTDLTITGDTTAVTAGPMGVMAAGIERRCEGWRDHEQRRSRRSMPTVLRRLRGFR